MQAVFHVYQSVPFFAEKKEWKLGLANMLLDMNQLLDWNEIRVGVQCNEFICRHREEPIGRSIDKLTGLFNYAGHR
jgi:hypothetical protein